MAVAMDGDHHRVQLDHDVDFRGRKASQGPRFGRIAAIEQDKRSVRSGVQPQGGAGNDDFHAKAFGL